MNNERGMTLVELLAAVTISTMILGAATTLFYSIQKTHQNAVQQFTDEALMEAARTLYFRALSDAGEVYVASNFERSELRVMTFSNGKAGYKSFYYETDTHRLTLYDYTGTFDDPNLTSASMPGAYSNGREIFSDNAQSKTFLSGPPHYKADQKEIKNTAVNNAAVLQIYFDLDGSTKAAGYPDSSTPLTVKLLNN